MITDLIDEQVDLGFETTSITFGNVHKGKIQALSVATRRDCRSFPNVPTMIESGLPTFIASSSTGSSRPRHAQDIIGRLNAEVNPGLKSPEMHDRFKKLPPDRIPARPRTSRRSSCGRFRNGRRWPGSPA